MSPIKAIEAEINSLKNSAKQARSLNRVRRNMHEGRMNPTTLNSILLSYGYIQVKLGDWEKLIEKQP